MKPLLGKLDAVEQRYGFTISELMFLQTYLSKFKHVGEVRTDALVKIGHWTNKAIEKAACEDEDLQRQRMPSLREQPLKYMGLACRVVGYDS